MPLTIEKIYNVVVVVVQCSLQIMMYKSLL